MIRSSVRWTTRVGTVIAGRMCRTSISVFICRSARAAPAGGAPRATPLCYAAPASEEEQGEVTAAGRPDGRVRVGVVGCGTIAQLAHLPYLEELSDRFTISEPAVNLGSRT